MMLEPRRRTLPTYAWTTAKESRRPSSILAPSAIAAWLSLVIILPSDPSANAAKPFSNPSTAVLPVQRQRFSPGPTGLMVAASVMRELREEGLQIPRDVSVTGFDNIKLAEFCSPPLTTVHIPREQIGHIIFENVLGDGRAEHDTGREIVIDPELVVRDSTGIAAKS